MLRVFFALVGPDLSSFSLSCEFVLHPGRVLCLLLLLILLSFILFIFHFFFLFFSLFLFTVSLLRQGCDTGNTVAAVGKYCSTSFSCSVYFSFFPFFLSVITVVQKIYLSQSYHMSPNPICQFSFFSFSLFCLLLHLVRLRCDSET